MGDNVYLGDRDGVRTPMQWTGDRNGGFSRADFARLYLPPLMDPVYGFQAVNVEAQLRTPTSLLRWVHRYIALRKEHPAFALGTYEALRHRGTSGSSPTSAATRTRLVLCAHNLARTPQAAELDLSAFAGLSPRRCSAARPSRRIGELPYLLTFAGRGFYWFRLREARRNDRDGGLRERYAEPGCVSSSPRSAGSARKERELRRHRGPRPDRPRPGDGVALMLLSRFASAAGRTISTSCSRRDEPRSRTRRSTCSTTRPLSARLIELATADATVPSELGRRRVLVARRLALPAAELRPLGVEQSNSSVVVGDELIVKLYRRLEPGINPELELLRFLCRPGSRMCRSCAAGGVTRARRWTTTLGIAQRFLPGCDATAGSSGARCSRSAPGFVARHLRDLGSGGRRDAQRPRERDRDDPAFAPEEPRAGGISGC